MAAEAHLSAVAVHICPVCGLHFELATELEWHLVHEHDKEWAAPDKRPRPSSKDG
ncbi:MAG: hypothetical protein ACR2MN_07295 [Acidimicrobiales bacterium]